MERKRVPLGNYITEYSVRNRSGEDIPVYSVTNSQGFCTEYFDKEVASKDKTTYKIVPRGYFAYNPSRINVGSVDWQRCEGRVIVSPLYNVFSVSEKMEQQYLFYFLKSNVGRQMIKAKASGSVRDNLKMDMLKEMTIPERTIEEQKKCVATLDALKTIISLWEKELEKLDELIKARFIEMFGSIHESTEYPYVAVKDLTDVISGGTPSRDRTEYWDGGTIPWVKTTELQNNVIIDVDEYITEAGLAGSSAKLVPAGTVLVAMYGQGKTRGMTAYLDIEATTNQACACILPSDKIDSVFLWKYFELSYDKLRSLAQGAGQPNLNGNMIKNFQVLVPPIEMQNEFVSFVHQVDKSKFININIIPKGGFYNGDKFYIS